MLYHLNLIPSFCFVLSNHYMPLYVLLCGPKIRNKYLVSCTLHLTYIRGLIWKIGRGSSECQTLWHVTSKHFWFYTVVRRTSLFLAKNISNYRTHQQQLTKSGDIKHPKWAECFDGFNLIKKKRYEESSNFSKWIFGRWKIIFTFGRYQIIFLALVVKCTNYHNWLQCTSSRQNSDSTQDQNCLYWWHV